MTPLLFAYYSIEKIQYFTVSSLPGKIPKFFHKDWIVGTQPAGKSLPGHGWKSRSIGQSADNLQRHHRSSALLTTATIVWSRLIL
jgi:hypothetical protein